MRKLDRIARIVLGYALNLALSESLEFLTPEVVLQSACRIHMFREAFETSGGDTHQLAEELGNYIINNLTLQRRRFYPDSAFVDENEDDDFIFKPQAVSFSEDMMFVIKYACENAKASEKEEIDLPLILRAMFRLKDSYAVYFMKKQGVEEVPFLRNLTTQIENARATAAQMSERMSKIFGESSNGENTPGAREHLREKNAAAAEGWKQFAPCVNELVENANPLIGRKTELKRTIQVLCRKDKNNPLHIGEPGVGKTAITYGLAQRINDGDVPDELKGAKIFSLDLGGMIAGTQFRGEFEKRLKAVLDGVAKEEFPILYIDEIHTLYGAGATGQSSLDASNLLKPYLADGHIRFIGATTYEEYKNTLEKSKSLTRRFQNIDVKEPSVEETVEILRGLKERYEQYHHVRYSDEILRYMTESSMKYIHERFLPDKAIDLMDEAGAFRKLEPVMKKTEEGKVNVVDKTAVNSILTSICRVPLETISTSETSGLRDMEKNLRACIFGQDEAITQVTNAVKFSKAGLIEEGKPLASLLFVGPTGVGKTEIAKKLADELGVKLLRFDMSEYGEKYSISKLIGSSAGYVGYENGGLLTEAVRKNPSAVLLLDEIEKAHDDIYNILLQVMDYATLTDNQGRKADFRNIILIMTSNIGADQVGKNTIGFMSERTGQTVMLDEVKRAFKPEFRNRLSRIVVFNSVDDAMAEKIVDKKLNELKSLLAKKNVKLRVSAVAKRLIKQKGVSAEYGAREVDRVLRNEIKPLLVDQILFGSLMQGGTAKLSASGESFGVDIVAR